VFNDSAYQAYVQVDSYINGRLVHHADAVLAPPNGSDGNTHFSIDWEEADRVVITASIRSSRGKTMWSEQKTYLLATDFDDGDTIEYAVVYQPANGQPFAYATAQPVAQAGGSVSLDGSASYDPDDDSLTFQWQQVSGAAVTLVDADKAVASFAVPASGVGGRLVFRLTVSDGKSSAFADVTVTIANRAPVASITAVSQALSGMQVSLDGTSSFDPDGDALTCKWEQVSGTPVTLSDPTQNIASFSAPYVSVSDTLIFRLTVSDGQLSDVQEFSVLVTLTTPGV